MFRQTSEANKFKGSLRSSVFRFLLAGESESQGEVARTHGARAKRGCYLCPRALVWLPLAWKETEKTAMQANAKVKF